MTKVRGCETVKEVLRVRTLVQGTLRHSRTAAMTDVYMQEIPEGVEAVSTELRLEPELAG